MVFFFFNDTATTEIYTLSLHDALPISIGEELGQMSAHLVGDRQRRFAQGLGEELVVEHGVIESRSEEHTSELQSRQYLVCRLLLEKKKKNRVCQNTRYMS